MVPEMPGRPYHQGVRAEFLGRRGEFPGRVPAAGEDPDVQSRPVAYVVEFADEPALHLLRVPARAYDLAGQRLAVDTGRADVRDQQRPPQPPGHHGRVRESMAARRRSVVAGYHRVGPGGGGESGAARGRSVVAGYHRVVQVAGRGEPGLGGVVAVPATWFGRLALAWMRLCLVHGFASL